MCGQSVWIIPHIASICGHWCVMCKCVQIPCTVFLLLVCLVPFPISMRSVFLFVSFEVACESVTDSTTNFTYVTYDDGGEMVAVAGSLTQLGLALSLSFSLAVFACWVLLRFFNLNKSKHSYTIYRHTHTRESLPSLALSTVGSERSYMTALRVWNTKHVNVWVDEPFGHPCRVESCVWGYGLLVMHTKPVMFRTKMLRGQHWWNVWRWHLAEKRMHTLNKHTHKNVSQEIMCYAVRDVDHFKSRGNGKFTFTLTYR